MADNFQITEGSGTTIAAHENLDGSKEQKIQVTNLPATQPVSASSLPLPSGASTETTLALIKAKTDNIDVLLSTRTKPADTQAVVVDNMTGVTPIFKTATLVTTATTADQVIITYTVTAGKTFYMLYVQGDVRLTVISATASILGTFSLEAPSGTKVYTVTNVNPTTSETEVNGFNIGTPIPVAAGTAIRMVCTPAAATSMTWIANFGGYEK